MFSLRAPVITVGVVLDIAIVKVTVIICVSRDVARDNLVEVSGVVTKIRRGRGCVMTFSYSKLLQYLFYSLL